MVEAGQELTHAEAREFAPSGQLKHHQHGDRYILIEDGTGFFVVNRAGQVKTFLDRLNMPRPPRVKKRRR